MEVLLYTKMVLKIYVLFLNYLKLIYIHINKIHCDLNMTDTKTLYPAYVSSDYKLPETIKYT